jgi:hypothetical protein
MSSENVKKKSWTGEEVEILGETYDPGKPDFQDAWRGKLKSRIEMLKYLRTGERYWYSDNWYGSEKRKTPA